MNWDEIYRTTRLEDLHWYPGAVDEILGEAVANGWLPGDSCLDIGSGQGTDAIYLAERGYKVTCLDISPAARAVALAEAARAGVTLDYVVGSALNMPFMDNQFDVAVERGCFHHMALEDRHTYASEIFRVLRTEGTYLYRSFSWKSQFHANPAEHLTEQAVRQVFEPFFVIREFGEYQARGKGGREQAEMHWAVMIKR